MIIYPSSVGRSKYEDLINSRVSFTALQDDIECDVAIIGGGYTGLSAAYNLAKANVKIALIDSGQFGDGASGRNGGQLGTGQRQWVGSLERLYGFETTKLLLDLWLEAKRYLKNILAGTDSLASFNAGHLCALHKPYLLKSYSKYIDDMRRYGYDSLQFLNKTQTAEKLGSLHYYASVFDSDSGHVNPLELVDRLTKLAYGHGAQLYENTSAINIEKTPGGFYVQTSSGQIKAAQVLLASNGYKLGSIKSSNLSLLQQLQSYIFPIYSYQIATAPLPLDKEILYNGESVEDSRFAVRYFRKTIDNSLIFGGAETYYGAPLVRIKPVVRRQLQAVYPQLADIPLTHAWGGIVAITRQRMPLIKELAPGLTYCGGYSGHGVCLAPFVGKLYAESIATPDLVREKFKLLKDLRLGAFPGGKYFRVPALFLALKFFAAMDSF